MLLHWVAFWKPATSFRCLKRKCRAKASELRAATNIPVGSMARRIYGSDDVSKLAAAKDRAACVLTLLGMGLERQLPGQYAVASAAPSYRLENRVDDRDQRPELRPLWSLVPHIAGRRRIAATSWQSYPGLIRKPAPPRAGSSLRRRFPPHC